MLAEPKTRWNLLEAHTLVVKHRVACIVHSVAQNQLLLGPRLSTLLAKIYWKILFDLVLVRFGQTVALPKLDTLEELALRRSVLARDPKTVLALRACILQLRPVVQTVPMKKMRAA